MTSTNQREKSASPDEIVAGQRNRQLGALSIIVLVLAALVAWTRYAKTSEEEAAGEVDLAAFETDDVASAIIYSEAGGDRVELVREGSAWRVKSRFSAPADQELAKSLVDRIVRAKRLPRPSLDNPEEYWRYGLTDLEAVHVELADVSGKELLHLLVGSSGPDDRDFVRLLGDGAPEGVFELTDFGGQYDHLRQKLSLRTQKSKEGEDLKLPSAREWLSLDDFAPLPQGAEVIGVTLYDGENEISLQGEDDPERPGSKNWKLLRPQESAANSTAVQGMIGALTWLRAVDVAGEAPADAVSLKVAQPERWIEVDYIDGANQMREAKVRLAFGAANEAGEIAVWKTTEREGEFIYWCDAGQAERTLRKLEDLLPPPPPVKVQHILVSWKGTGVDPKDPERTREQAEALANQLKEQAELPDADWKAMQTEYNEDDSDPYHVYEVTKTANLVQPFKDLSLSLEVGEVGVVESKFGYHVIKRIE